MITVRVNAVRIICGYDARPEAQAIATKLQERGYAVEVLVGRFVQIAEANKGRETIVLLWSQNAACSDYLPRWATSTPVDRLVEITLTPYYPNFNGRRYHPIEFEHWSGEARGSIWNRFEERLREAADAIDPPKPEPRRAAAVMMAFGATTVMAAGAVRYLEQAPHQLANMVPNSDEAISQTADATQAPIVQQSNEIEMGGPVGELHEPDSSDGMAFGPLAPRVRGLDAQSINISSTADVLGRMQYRDPNLLNRLTDLAESGFHGISTLANADDHN
jgi:hypothetical protein